MFEIGFSEVLITAIVALLVLGPERLPRAARLAGLWVRKARAQWYSVKAELERELLDEDLKRSLKGSLDEVQQQMQSGQAQLKRDFEAIDASVTAPPTKPATTEPPSP